MELSLHPCLGSLRTRAAEAPREHGLLCKADGGRAVQHGEGLEEALMAVQPISQQPRVPGCEHQKPPSWAAAGGSPTYM